MKNDNKTLRFFLDSEFNEHAARFAIDPISVALVPENQQQPNFYAVSSDFDPRAITPWLQDNVVVHLPPPQARLPNDAIRDAIVDYLKKIAPAQVGRVEIWAHNGATDQVVLASFFGGLMGLRRAFNAAGLPSPEFRDTKELVRATGHRIAPPQNAHDCLVDALWTRDLFASCAAKLGKSRQFLLK